MRQVLFAALLLFAASAFCQDCTTSVVVNVFDDRLHIDVQTLKADDFQVRMDKKDLSVVNMGQKYDSRLLVLLETDGSEKDSKIQDVVETITRMARQAPEGKPVAFGVYAEHAIFTKDFIADPEKRNDQIGDVIERADSLGKRVALYDALHQALQLFGAHQPGDTILLVASPYDDKSNRSLGDIKKEFLESGTRLMAMLRRPMSHVDHDFVSNTHEPEKSLFLDFAERSGGAHSEFDPRFFGFSWRGYMLEVKVPEQDHKSHKWSLKLHEEVRAAFKHAKIFYPELLPSCHVATVSGGH
ncbi:MAG TPA: hypothetical protein VI636_04185 [Candidatus Angelobacter sp.]